ncbi:MAG: hypothetical protein R3A10_07855 [Caldilineaceae bacterium]
MLRARPLDAHMPQACRLYRPEQLREEGADLGRSLRSSSARAGSPTCTWT